MVYTRNKMKNKPEDKLKMAVLKEDPTPANAYRLLFENSLDGFAYCRLIYENHVPVDFIYLDVNPAFGRLTGLTNITGKLFSHLYPENAVQNNEVIQIYASVASSGNPGKFDIYFAPFEKWMSVSVICPEKGFFIAIFNDITAHKLAEKALYESEERYRKVVEISPTGIAIYQDGKFVYINPAGLSLLGCIDQNTIIGKPVLSIVHPESKEIVIKRMTNVASGMDLPPLEENLVRIDGSVFIGEVIALATTFNGKPAGQVLVRDITERKLAEENMKQLNRKLKELNATKDKFFSIIAHDLKSPFTSIIGFSEMLIENFRKYDNNRIEEQLRIIADSTKHASDLLENLLLWSRSQTGKIEFIPVTTDLKKCIIENIELLKNQFIQKSITISTSLPDDCNVVCDRNMINTVLRNLLSNAAKFTPKYGKVSVIMESTANFCELSISDSGIGIPKENLEQLFKIEYNLSTRGTENEKGTGLGLILCNEFIEKQGGRIWVESNVNKGSVFHFTMPVRR
jgi:PAS domain S-box-containing protein